MHRETDGRDRSEKHIDRRKMTTAVATEHCTKLRVAATRHNLQSTVALMNCLVGNGDEAIPMLQYESASAGVSPRPASGIPGPDVTVTSSVPASKQSSSPTNQLRVQVSTVPDVGSVHQYSTGVVSVAAETNTGN